MTLCPQPDGSVLQFIPAPVLPVGMGLTPKQAALLAWVGDFMARHGVSPTLNEIQIGIGLANRCSVMRHLNALSERGYITRRRHAHRSIQLTNNTNHRRGFPA